MLEEMCVWLTDVYKDVKILDLYQTLIFPLRSLGAQALAQIGQTEITDKSL